MNYDWKSKALRYSLNFYKIQPATQACNFAKKINTGTDVFTVNFTKIPRKSLL